MRKNKEYTLRAQIHIAITILAAGFGNGVMNAPHELLLPHSPASPAGWQTSLFILVEYNVSMWRSPYNQHLCGDFKELTTMLTVW